VTRRWVAVQMFLFFTHTQRFLHIFLTHRTYYTKTPLHTD
jgi:hypothetical protein